MHVPDRALTTTHASAVLEGALWWLARNVRHFRLPTPAEDEAAEGVFLEARRKAFGELALVPYLLSRFAPLRGHPALAILTDHVEREVRAPGFAFDMMRRPNLFPLYTTVLMALDACGRPLPEYRGRLQRVLEWGFMDRLERTAWNQVDLAYYMDAAGLRHGMPPLEELCRASTARRFPALAHVRNIDVYGLTHILFHLGDFGRRGLSRFLGPDLEEVRETVALLLGMYLHRHDHDLAAELLICCRCLGTAPEPFHAAAWRSLAQAQCPAGDMPDRVWNEAALDGLNADDAAERRFHDNYHPTLVAVLAGAVELYQEPPDDAYVH